MNDTIKYHITSTNQIEKLNLNDNFIDTFFQDILLCYCDNTKQLIKIFKKIIKEESISSAEKEVISDLWSHGFYKKILHEIKSKIIFESNEELFLKLFNTFKLKINDLLKEFTIKTIKSSIKGVIEDKIQYGIGNSNNIYQIDGKKYLISLDEYYEIIDNFGEYYIIKNIEKEGENKKLVNSKGNIILDNKTFINIPKKIGNKNLCHWNNNSIHGISDISGDKEKELILDKTKIIEIKEIGKNIFCLWKDNEGIGLSDISGSAENKIITQKKDILMPRKVGNKILCKWKNIYGHGLSELLKNEEKIIFNSLESYIYSMHVGNIIFHKIIQNNQIYLYFYSKDGTEKKIGGKNRIWDPILIGGRIFIRWKENNLFGLSEIIGENEKIILFPRKFIGEPKKSSGKTIVECSRKIFSSLNEKIDI